MTVDAVARPGAATQRPGANHRIVWFADLETLAERLDLLKRLRDEIGLTTVMLESHISHTSGFAASAAVAGPLEDWRQRPGLRLHREVFGVAEPAMAVLPGVVGGMDDGNLVRALTACRAAGLEVWGHAGLWCYGAELFPEFAARDLWGRPLVPGSLPWGTMFCPNRRVLQDWIISSLQDAAARYELDGWTLDHARFPSPGHVPSLAACGCNDCADAAATYGVDFDRCRLDIRLLAADLAAIPANRLTALSRSGASTLLELLIARPGVLAWFQVRAKLLADRLAEIATSIQAASAHRVQFGTDVFPPSVALLGGHVYAEWARSVTYLTGGIAPKIWWGTVAKVATHGLGVELAARVEDLTPDSASAIVAEILGSANDLGTGIEPDGVAEAQAGAEAEMGAEAATRAFLREIGAIAAVRSDLPVYPPIAALPSPEALRKMCRGIVAAGLDGALITGLERYDAERLRIVRAELADRGS